MWTTTKHGKIAQCGSLQLIQALQFPPKNVLINPNVTPGFHLFLLEEDFKVNVKREHRVKKDF